VLPREEAAGLEYEITRPPLSGGLSGAPPDVEYTPRRGFTGRDRFEWRARSGRGLSNTATVTVTCNASGANQPPHAFNQSVTARGGQPVTFTLQYSDRDGPGPYRIFITRPPAHGTISGLDNDITYTAAGGYEGADTIEWEAGDGDARSAPATVGIKVGR
jgi:hypothetical protein